MKCGVKKAGCKASKSTKGSNKSSKSGCKKK